MSARHGHPAVTSPHPRTRNSVAAPAVVPIGEATRDAVVLASAIRPQGRHLSPPTRTRGRQWSPLVGDPHCVCVRGERSAERSPPLPASAARIGHEHGRIHRIQRTDETLTYRLHFAPALRSWVGVRRRIATRGTCV